MRSLIFLLAVPLFAASLVIDSGSASDQYFYGGLTYTNPAASDTTVRFSQTVAGKPQQFGYKIPAANDVPYVVKFNFMEPSPGVVRMFVVGINDLPVTAPISMQGYLIPFSRSVIAFAADGFINIRFDTLVRSAVISSIEIAPLFQTLNSSLPVVTAWSSCKSGQVLAGPLGPGIPSPSAVWPGLKPYPNSWDSLKDTSGNEVGWSCDGLQAYTFRMPDGSSTGPYVAVKMPDDFVPDPALWVKQ